MTEMFYYESHSEKMSKIFKNGEVRENKSTPSEALLENTSIGAKCVFIAS